MDIQINYGNAVTVLPAVASGVLERANVTDLKVLLTVCTLPDLTKGGSLGDCAAKIAARAGCTAAGAQASLAFWRGAGILALREEGSADRECATDASATAVAEPAILPSPAEKATPTRETAEASVPAVEAAPNAPRTATPRKPARHDELPRYTTEELTNLLGERKEAADFIDECQQIWGKIFNTHEVNILLGLVDYLGLEWDYVLTLLAYCAGAQEKRGVKKSLHYVETTAFAFYDEGVNDLISLQEKLRRLELMAESEGQLRNLFGMGNRALTPKEKKCFSTWLYEFKYDMDIIRRAYDVTVDAKGSPNLNYMNSVLANWNKDGLRTVSEVEAAQQAFRAEKEKKEGHATQNGSFDTDDFFAAAVRRSLGDDFASDGTGN